MFINHWAAVHADLNNSASQIRELSYPSSPTQQQQTGSTRKSSQSSSRLASLPVPCHDRSLLEVVALRAPAPTPPVPRTSTISVQADAKSRSRQKGNMGGRGDSASASINNNNNSSSSSSSSSSTYTPTLQCLRLQEIPSPSIPKAIKKVRDRAN